MNQIKSLMNKYQIPAARPFITAVLSVLLSGIFVIGSSIKNTYSLPKGIASLLIFILLGILFFVILNFLFILLDKIKLKTPKKELKPFIVFFICLAFFMIFYFIQFLGFYPGLFVFDAPTQCISYFNHNISEHHPLLHTLLLAGIIDLFTDDFTSINHAVALYTLIQITLCSISFSLYLAVIYGKIKSVLITVLNLLFLTFFPPVVLLVMSATKDTFFIIFFILSIAILFLLSDCDEKKAKLYIIPTALCVTLMTLFRNNCVYAVPFFFVPAVILLKKKRKQILIAAGIFAVLFVLYKTAFVPQIIAHKTDSREMMSVPIQIAVKVYNDEDAKISDESKAVIENLLEDYGLEYCPTIADLSKAALKNDYYEAHKSEVNKMFIKLAMNNPGKALEAFLCLNCGLWYPNEVLTLYIGGAKGYWPVTCFSPAVINPKIKAIYQFYVAFESAMASGKYPVMTFIFNPGLYFCIFLVMSGYALEKKNSKLILFAPFILVYFLTFLLGPVALVRYALFLYVLFPIYFVEATGNNLGEIKNDDV